MNEKNKDSLFELLLWWKGLKETTNDTFFPLYFDTSRYLVLMGGGGSGKSVFAARKLLERATSESGHRFLVCRKVAKTLYESCIKLIIGQIEEYYRDIKWSFNKTDMRISFENGSEILFFGLDDVEKLKSIFKITGIWIEEASELSESDFNQLDIRMRGQSKYYKQIIISFNPISVMHWLKKRFFDRTPPQARVHKSTYLDNRFLDEQSKNVLEGYRETDEYYYSVYALGKWGTTGKTVFSAQKIANQLSKRIKPQRTGYFEYSYDGLKISDIKFCDDDNGFIKIYEMPNKDRSYVIGGDTAGEGSDFFIGQVIDAEDGKEIAVFRKSMDADIYAKQMYCLGKFYFDALLAIETNFNIYPVYELERLGYENQYVRESVDDFTHEPKKSYGFVTTSKTRPLILSELIKIMRDTPELICDDDTLSEMLTFVRRDNMRMEAENGAHDDCIMALAIAQYVRPCQTKRYIEPPKCNNWTLDMWEDFMGASREEKEYLLKKWRQ